MRVNWFSPLLPAHTDIAHYTSRIASALHRTFDITFWTNQDEPLPLPGGGAIRKFEPALLHDVMFRKDMLRGINIYNVGNNAQFHDWIFAVSSIYPGIAILHDIRLHHFFFELDRTASTPWMRYIRLCREIYGTSGASAAEEIVRSGGLKIDDHVSQMPLLEPWLVNAFGAICHSTQATRETEHRSFVPVLSLPLPFETLAKPTETTRQWASPFKLIVFGFLNRNRRVLEILETLAAARTYLTFTLHIVGELWDAGAVREKIAQLGLQEQVKIEGYVSEQELDRLIAESHLSLNLRFPTMGEASGAVLRAWAQATPVVVSDVGYYAELPDRCVFKIDPEQERADLDRILQRLASYPDSFRKAGVHGQHWGRTNHSPDQYCRSLFEALTKSGGLAAQFAERKTITRAAHVSRAAGPVLDRAVENLLAFQS